MNPIDQLNALPDNANWQQQFAQQAPVKKKKPGITAWLSELGGTGGALGGAAIGTALLPGVGTVLGGLAGGFLGGTTGKLAENKIRDNQYRLSQALGEGAIEGITAAGPLKLGKILTKGSATLAKGAGKEAAVKAANEALNKSIIPSGTTAGGLLEKSGSRLRADARGVVPGATQEGAAVRLRNSKADELNLHLNQIGAKGAPAEQLATVEQHLKDTGKQIGEVVKNNNRAVNPSELLSIKQTAAKTAETSLGHDAAHPMLTDVAKKLDGVKNLTDVQKLKGLIDSELKSFYAKGERAVGAPPTSVEKALKSYRDGMNKVLQDGIEGYKDLNGAYRKSEQAARVLVKKANQPNLKVFGIDTGISTDKISKAKDMIGRVLQKGAGGTPPGGVPPVAGAVAPEIVNAGYKGPGILNTAARVAAGSQIASALQPSPVDAALAQPDTTALDGTVTDGTQTDFTAPVDNFAAEMEQVKAAAKQALASGDTKGLENILKVADLLQSTHKATAASNAPLSATAAESIAGANAGLESIAMLQQEMAKDPSVRAKTAVPGRGLVGGIGNNLLGTSNYQAAMGNILDSWARIKTGAAISNTEEARFNANLPEAFDPPETVQKKLKIISNLFTSVANRTGSAGTDTEAAIMNGGSL